ncbi:MAG: YggS family pyridoxal phosphate-dependent enzyme [Pseudomonadota bacterium]
MPSNNLHVLELRLRQVLTRIDEACDKYRRDPAQVCLVAASKTQAAEVVMAARDLGISNFGENYVNEGVDKVVSIGDRTLNWHFIGRIQSNKTKVIAEHFDWVHTIDRFKIAQRLSHQCPAGKTLQTLIQVNIDGDPSKAGVKPEDCAVLLEDMLSLDNLAPRGLMTILAQDDASNPVASYQSMAELHQRLAEQLPDDYSGWKCLSMGMSGDLEAAIAAGATHIRIGTDIFGRRQP